MQEHQTRPAQAGSRLDVLVASLYPQFSRSALGRLFDEKMVRVNGDAQKAAYRVRADDQIQVDETYLNHQPAVPDLPLIYEDDDVLVINKPAGLLTHSKGALNLEATVAFFIYDKLTDKKMTGNRAGIVHRLDRGTSGVMIAAKHLAAHAWLQKQFSQRKVKKTYRAVVLGIVKPAEAVIETPIGRNPRRPNTFKAISSGKPATTRYILLRSFKKDDQNYSELQLSPETGRTHQLRVHLAYIGHPIVGDHIYGQGGQPVLLHAQKLELTLPNRQRKTFTAPLPAHFEEFLND